MKLFIGTIVLSMSALAGFAQDPVPVVAPVPAPEVRAKVVAELAAVAQKIGTIKNSPFSAEEVNESVQTLADGNRIVRSSTGKFYRNSEGRVRREMAGGTGGIMGSVFTTGQGVSIVNPSLNEKYLLDSKLKTAQLVELAQLQRELTVVGSGQAAERATLLRKANGDLRDNLRSTAPLAIAGHMGPLPAIPPVPPIAITTGVGGGFAYTIEGNHSKYESRTEELGTQTIEGVAAEGTRKTTTIPAGAIGNERPIEIVYERWFSKELGVVVMSRNLDPRFGEQTYKMTNIVRAEPDPSLFSVPTEYRKITGTPVYRTSATAAEPAKASVVRVSGSATSKARP